MRALLPRVDLGTHGDDGKCVFYFEMICVLKIEVVSVCVVRVDAGDWLSSDPARGCVYPQFMVFNSSRGWTPTIADNISSQATRGTGGVWRMTRSIF
jgi:hypothetical protein